MLRHMVMWTLKPEAEGGTAAQNAAKMKAMLEALNGKVPTLQKLEVSTEIVEAQPAADVCLYSEFLTKADLDAYQVHPEHQKCVAFIRTVVSSRNVLDFIC